MSLRSHLIPLLIPVAIALAPYPAFAQDPEPAPPRAEAPIELLSDLAEVLGEAHAVRSACNGDADQTWRNYMMSLFAMEAPAGPRRASLTTAFNRGYRSQTGRTPTCTADMPVIEAGIARRGRELAEQVARTYLN